jgi:hypothetical protein
LVFGILLDECPETARAEERAVAPLLEEPEPVTASVAARAPVLPEANEPEAPARDVDEPAVDTWPDRPAFALASSEPAPAQAQPVVREVVQSAPSEPTASVAEEPEFIVRKPAKRVRREEGARESAAREAQRESRERDDELLALKKRLPPAAVEGKRALVAWMVQARVLVLPWLARLQAWFKGMREQGLGEARSSLGALLSRVRALMGTQLERLKTLRAAQQSRREQRTQAAPRVQRSQVAREPSAKPEPARQQVSRVPARNRRLYAVGLSVVGVALGVYALAPRSGADRIRVPHDSLRPTPQPLADTPAPESLPAAAPAKLAAPVQAVPSPAAQPAVNPQPNVPSPAPEPSQLTNPTASAGKLAFGAPDVANGRTFVLRMSGPVQEIEGETRADGFTVRVPGRLALDRASPIATSHRAVARALILNRGDYAELTVGFLPGMTPKYRVIGKDNAIEVTLERR